MPEATPAEVSTSPSSTNNTSGSSLTWGNKRAKRAASRQCVVAGRPSSRPAAASTYEPVQIDIVRGRPRNARRKVSEIVPSRSARPAWMPGTRTVSAVSSTSRSWSGSTL